jgi:hypothetical protein
MINPVAVMRPLLPVLNWLLAYQHAWVPDLLAGLAVWAVMVPEGMAYSGIVAVPHIRCVADAGVAAGICLWRGCVSLWRRSLSRPIQRWRTDALGCCGLARSSGHCGGAGCPIDPPAPYGQW